MSAHPTRDQLERWLRGEPLDAVGHLDDCDECLDVLDQLSRLDPAVKRLFLAATRPEPGFVERLQTSIERRRRDADTWAALVDLFSLSWRTPDAMWPDDG